MTAQLTDFTSRMTELVHELRLATTSDSEAMLRAASKAAVSAVPGAEYASVTLVSRDGAIETPIVVGDLAGKSDALQRELGEGPCVRAAISDETVWIDDMHTEERWPRFAAAAAELGVASMVCFTLYIDGPEFGALNLHSTQVDAFGPESRSIGELFAAHAATSFAAVREREQLRTALTSRDLIGQAKGMIMERFKIDADAAFTLLARLSQDSNTKLVDIAKQIVTAG